MMVKNVLVLSFLLLFSSISSAQTSEVSKIKHNAHLGGGLGYFWIGGKNFDQLYGKKGGWIFTLDGALRVTEDYKLAVGYESFNKTGKTAGTIETDLTWNQSFLNLGIRKAFSTNDFTDAHFGLGISVVNVIEESEVIETSDNTTGFYIEYGGVGTDKPDRKFGFYFNLKYVFANVKGKGGLGGDDVNVGGFFITFGLALFP